jgi:hypothetical protein
LPIVSKANDLEGRGFRAYEEIKLAPQLANNAIPDGQLRSANTWGEYNNIHFAVQQALAKMQTATLVKVVSCTNSGGVSPVGLVDVLPMVNQIDGLGNATPHTTVHNIPYLRIQGGTNAIIIDPQAGDVGICVFASRDISKVKTTKTQANPGSFRQYSFSDGMFLGGVLNGVPSQYVMFGSSGITMHSPTAIILESPVLTHNGVNISATHVHNDVQTGTSDTGVPH